MKRWIRVACVLALFVSIGFAAEALAAPPALPHIIYGAVTIADAPATPGTPVYAYVAEVLVAQTTVQTNAGQSVFLVTIPGGEAVNQPDIGQSQGASVRFRVGAIWAPQTTQWHAGAVSEIPLHVYPNRWLPVINRA